MKNVILAVLAAVLVLAAGCIFPPVKSGNVPSDLEMRYSYGACHAEWGRTDITIDANGNGIYQSGRGQLLDNGRFSEEDFYKTFKLNESERLALLNTIEESGFYSLNDNYDNPGIVDGGCNFVSVTKNNVTKSVSVSNTPSPAAFSKTADAISAAAESKTK